MPISHRITLECGCYHDQQTGWNRCASHQLQKRVEAQMEAERGIPKCPECHSDARRPKCLFELGGNCPRHNIREKWYRECLTRRSGIYVSRGIPVRSAGDDRTGQREVDTSDLLVACENAERYLTLLIEGDRNFNLEDADALRNQIRAAITNA